MSGSHYIALSGLRARVDELDRLASDIANVGTAGYKGERDSARGGRARPRSTDRCRRAIDTTLGGRRLDTTAGALAPTGRPLDVAIDGDGLLRRRHAGRRRATRATATSRSTPTASSSPRTASPVQGAERADHARRRRSSRRRRRHASGPARPRPASSRSSSSPIRGQLGRDHGQPAARRRSDRRRRSTRRSVRGGIARAVERARWPIGWRELTTRLARLRSAAESASRC